jgi:biopolymer transport protein ExbD
MRRFSQRNSLVTLSEINITPLLDLAFVLLIIFIITRPMLEQSMDLKLPQGGKPQSKLNSRDVCRVEISPQGLYRLDGRLRTLNEIEADLVRSARANPNLVVYIRADKKGQVDHLMAVVDRCQRNNIYRVSFATVPDQH